MLGTPRQEHHDHFMEKSQLVTLKTRAMRSGLWFKVLQRIDRALIDATIKVANSVRSITLARSLLTIVQKLRATPESRLSQAIRNIGFPIARKLSLIAQEWGNNTAKKWSTDTGFARYLAITHAGGYYSRVKCGVT